MVWAVSTPEQAGSRLNNVHSADDLAMPSVKNSGFYLCIKANYCRLNSSSNHVIYMLQQPSILRTNIGLLIVYKKHRHTNSINQLW